MREMKIQFSYFKLVFYYYRKKLSVLYYNYRIIFLIKVIENNTEQEHILQSIYLNLTVRRLYHLPTLHCVS